MLIARQGCFYVNHAPPAGPGAFSRRRQTVRSVSPAFRLGYLLLHNYEAAFFAHAQALTGSNRWLQKSSASSY